MKRYAKLPVYIVLAALVAGSLAASAKDAQKRFKGEIIYIGDSSIEMKKGRNDIKLTVTGETQYVGIDGKTGGREIIEICQIAEALYRSQDKQNVMIKIRVLKQSFCKK